MKILKELFSEGSSLSVLRVMALIALLSGTCIAFYGIHEARDLGGIAEVCSVFVGAAFAGKVGQKYLETKPVKEDE
jgi:hypothetical protein